MPIGYLITLVFLGTLTVAALPRPRRMNRLRYALTVAIDELPHLALLWLVLVTALAWTEGDLEAPVGALLAGVAVLLFVGLAELLRRCLRAAPTVDRAIEHRCARRDRGVFDQNLEGSAGPMAQGGA